MARFDLKLLGGFEARLDSGQKIALPTRKAEALLAYLALAGGKPRSRDQLAGLLWSDRGEAQAKGSLRQALTALRHGLPENGAPVIEAESEGVALEPSAVAVDVLAFERLAKNGSNGNLARASDLYRGPLLEGFSVRDPAFDDWLTQERARLHRLAVGAAERLLAGLLADGDSAAAIAAAQRLIALDPERESAYRTLMRLYAEQGQRGLAARQYETCREVLQSMLGVEPAPATRRLYEEIVGATEAEPAAEPPRRAPLPLPANPSVAVLPFANLSGDPDQSYLSDGLTEDVITELARFPGLFVIGTESSLALKDCAITPAQAARDLGVEYLVEGSVRRAHETLRVTVQLIDPATGHRLWAERYDRPFADVFAIQDEIVGNVAGTLSVNIEQARAARTRARSPEGLNAYDCCLRAKKGLLDFTLEGYSQGRRLFEQAVELDPECAAAWAGLAIVYNKDACFLPGADPSKSYTKGRACAEKALDLDRTLSRAHLALAWRQLDKGELDLARHSLEQASTFTPNDSETLALVGLARAYLGDFQAAMAAAEKGLRMNPYSPDLYWDAIGVAHFFQGRYKETVACNAQESDPHPENWAWNAACYAHLGEADAARRAVDRFLREYSELWAGDPTAGPADYTRWILNMSNPFTREEDRERLAEGMRLAGLPVE
ncbi:MAG: BTAD domain-containing putative transcriptional regulator [Kiloniellales bacterium]|nr:BTAD domain-containing putative transcriptional regulator [Kiloniellales bacterium]